MSHFGDLIGGKQTPKPAPVAVSAPVVEEAPPKVEVQEEVNLSSMSKRELELYGRTIGIELDRRLSKSKLVKQVKEAQSKQ